MPLTRRGFLLTPAAFAAVPQPVAPVRLPRPVRLGVIGLEGHVADIMGPLPRLPDVTVAAVAHRDPEALRGFVASQPRARSARTYADYRQMLAREELDVVAVTNDNQARAAAVLACASRGLHVIAEKPLSLTRSDLLRIKRMVAKKRTSLGMLLTMRFSSHYRALKQIVDQGLIGEVMQMDAQKSYKAGKRPAWYLRRATYGGTIPWIGIHLIDLMRWTSGRELRQAAGFQGRHGDPELGEMETVTGSVFKLDNGGVATLRLDYLRPPMAATHGDDRLRLAGVKGVAEYQAATGLTVVTVNDPPRVWEPPPAPEPAFIDFLQSVYNGQPSALPLADIYRACEITLAAAEAAVRGRIVRT